MKPTEDFPGGEGPDNAYTDRKAVHTLSRMTLHRVHTFLSLSVEPALQYVKERRLREGIQSLQNGTEHKRSPTWLSRGFCKRCEPPFPPPQTPATAETQATDTAAPRRPCPRVPSS